eukprot:2033081-Rhodomonas_salina.2
MPQSARHTISQYCTSRRPTAPYATSVPDMAEGARREIGDLSTTKAALASTLAPLRCTRHTRAQYRRSCRAAVGW